jgi:site-specific recombinase XerD
MNINPVESNQINQFINYSINQSIDQSINRSINPLSWNTDFSIHENLNLDSNVSEVSDSHQTQHFSLMISTDEGRTILMNASRHNAPISFVVISILIQMSVK